MAWRKLIPQLTDSHRTNQVANDGADTWMITIDKMINGIATLKIFADLGILATDLPKLTGGLLLQTNPINAKIKIKRKILNIDRAWLAQLAGKKNVISTATPKIIVR